MPAIEAVLTTTPRWPSGSGSFSPMAAATRRVALNVPTAFISMVLTKDSLSWGTPPRPTVRPPPTPPPATLTRMPSDPRDRATSTAPSTSSSSVTSPAAAATPSPSVSANAAARSASRSKTTTRAPDVHQPADRRLPEASGSAGDNGRPSLCVHDCASSSVGGTRGRPQSEPAVASVDLTITTISNNHNSTSALSDQGSHSDETLLSGRAPACEDATTDRPPPSGTWSLCVHRGHVEAVGPRPPGWPEHNRWPEERRGSWQRLRQ